MFVLILLPHVCDQFRQHPGEAFRSPVDREISLLEVDFHLPHLPALGESEERRFKNCVQIAGFCSLLIRGELHLTILVQNGGEASTDLCLKFKALQMKTLFVEGKAACNLRSSSLSVMIIFLML